MRVLDDLLGKPNEHRYKAGYRKRGIQGPSTSLIQEEIIFQVECKSKKSIRAFNATEGGKSSQRSSLNPLVS